MLLESDNVSKVYTCSYTLYIGSQYQKFLIGLGGSYFPLFEYRKTTQGFLTTAYMYVMVKDV